MSDVTSTNVDIAKRYIAALEAGVTGAALTDEFFAPDAQFIELPNRFTPNGVVRNVAEASEASERGKKAVPSQRYTIKTITAQDDRVAIEFEWTGTLGVPVGSLPVGGTIRAHIATVLELREGKIVRQRHYDCYEPF